jgi:hypothetical protein
MEMKVITTISQIMDLLEVGDTQSLANSLHEFLEYQKCLQRFNEVENEHKDLLKQQRLGLLIISRSLLWPVQKKLRP